jgi:SNF2 family DNA or RNA helicase
MHGLNWMVSLHHNGLSGILADEMVRISFAPSYVN